MADLELDRAMGAVGGALQIQVAGGTLVEADVAEGEAGRADERLSVVFGIGVDQVEVEGGVLDRRAERDDEFLILVGIDVAIVVDPGRAFVVGLNPHHGVWFQSPVTPVHILQILRRRHVHLHFVTASHWKEGIEGLLKEFDEVLEHYSSFSVQKVSKKGKKLGVLDVTVVKEIVLEDLESEKNELMKEQCAVYWTTLALNVEDYSGTAAKLMIEMGSIQSTRSGKMASEPVNVNEFQELARRALPKMYFDFYNGGAEDQHTLRENMEAFRRITFRPRVLVDVSRIDMSTTILGYPTSAPIMIAPTGLHKLAHPEGEVATARAAAACNTIMAMSFSADCTVEEVYKRRDVTAVLVQRAERNGFKAIMLTVDTPRLGRREADIKNKMIAPQPKNLEGLLSTEAVSDNGSKLAAFAAETLDPSLCWKDIDWLRSVTSLPILVKGVLTAEDAIKAMEIGVAGIVVSNHGARQLDYSPATITVLEEVVRAVGGKIPVLIDGGVRRGTDIFKALALGAQAVMIGRPVLYGLAAKGEYGVRSVIEMLKDELELTMALSGCPTVKDITRSHVRTEYDRFNCRL
ncbi:unnamed protein product [Camellia sinensis]